jgi:hypothetical protein
MSVIILSVQNLHVHTSKLIFLRYRIIHYLYAHIIERVIITPSSVLTKLIQINTVSHLHRYILHRFCNEFSHHSSGSDCAISSSSGTPCMRIWIFHFRRGVCVLRSGGVCAMPQWHNGQSEPSTHHNHSPHHSRWRTVSPARLPETAIWQGGSHCRPDNGSRWGTRLSTTNYPSTSPWDHRQYYERKTIYIEIQSVKIKS